MPRPLPANPALIVEDPAPLERFAGFPHAIEPFPVAELLAQAGFNRLPAPVAAPTSVGLPRPSEPEAIL